MDVDRVSAALERHKAKNYANAYMLPAGDEERDAKARGDWQQATQAFSDHQAKFHAVSNTAKNAALYVNLDNGVFSAPNEQITEAMVDDIAARNAGFLELVSPRCACWPAGAPTRRPLRRCCLGSRLGSKN